jgi:hypothetical protein
VATTDIRIPPADPWLIELTYHHQQRWWFTSNDEPETWEISADVADPDHTHPAAHVGDLEIVLLDLDHTRNPFDVLDGDDATLGRIAEILFDPATGQLDPVLDAQLEPLGSRLLILKTARLIPAWRGFGLGVLLAGTAIKKLSGGVRFAVCDPAPLPDLDADEHEVEEDPVEQAVVSATLSEVWGQLGFEDYRDSGVHVLDLNLVTLDNCLQEQQKRAERFRVLD